MCGTQGSVSVAGVNPRGLLHCSTCELVFVPEQGHVSAEAERERYALHTNTPEDEGYVSFLATTADAVLSLPAQSPRVLDFGSGPNAVLTGLLRHRGVDCTPYDPLYGLGLGTRDETFDVVVLCEVLEHLRDLPAELGLLKRLVAPGGHVVVHTYLRPADPAQIGTWWYTLDPTHVNFFSVKSLEWFAAALGMRLVSCDGSELAVLGGEKD